MDKDEALKLYEAMREDDLEIDNVNESPVKFDRTKIVLNLWANYNKAELKGPERSAILRANRSFMASSGFMTEVPIAGETYYGLRPKEYVTINYYDKNSKTSTMVIYRLVDSTIDDRNKALDSRDVIVTQAEYVATEFIAHGQLEASSFYLSDHDAVTVKKVVTKEQEQPAPKVETPIVIKKKEIVTQEIPTLDEKDTAKVFTLLNVLNAPIRKDASNIKFEYISTKIGETKSILYRYVNGNLFPYKVVGTIGESGLVTLQRDVETKDKKALERDLKLIPTKLTSLEGIEIEDERLFDSIEKIEDKKEKKQAVENYNKLKELLCQ